MPGAVVFKVKIISGLVYQGLEFLPCKSNVNSPILYLPFYFSSIFAEQDNWATDSFEKAVLNDYI